MLALRDLLQVIPDDVSTLAFGIACSTGPLLLSSGAPGTRRALPHSRIIVHQGSAGIGGSAVHVALQADHLRDARGDRVPDVYSHLLTERIIWVGTAIDAAVARAPIAQLLFREPDSPDSKVQLSVNCASSDLPRHRNHMCGAGTRCRSRPDLRRDRDVLTVDSGQRIDRLRADTDHDHVFTARQAQQYGLADHVITRR